MILSQRVRSKYTDREKAYLLRDSEIHTLSEIGKFRVVAENDLPQFAYNGDRSRRENDVEMIVPPALESASPESSDEECLGLRQSAWIPRQQSMFSFI